MQYHLMPSEYLQMPSFKRTFAIDSVSKQQKQSKVIAILCCAVTCYTVAYDARSFFGFCSCMKVYVIYIW